MATKKAKTATQPAGAHATDQEPLKPLSLDDIKSRTVAKTVERMQPCTEVVAGKRNVIRYPCRLSSTTPNAHDYLARSSGGRWYRLCHDDIAAGLASADPETGFGWREIEDPPTVTLLEAAATIKTGSLYDDDCDDDKSFQPRTTKRGKQKPDGTPKEPKKPKRMPSDVAAGWRSNRILSRRDTDSKVFVSSGFVLWAMENGGAHDDALEKEARLRLEEHHPILPVLKSDPKAMRAIRALAAPFVKMDDAQLVALPAKRREWAALLKGQLNDAGEGPAQAPPEPATPRRKKVSTAANKPVAKKPTPQPKPTARKKGATKKKGAK